MMLIIIKVNLNNKGLKISSNPEIPLYFFTEDSIMDLDAVTNEIANQIGTEVVDDFSIMSWHTLPTLPLETIDVGDVVKIVTIEHSEVIKEEIDRIRKITEKKIWAEFTYSSFDINTKIHLIDLYSFEYLVKPEKEEIEEFMKNEKLLNARNKLWPFLAHSSNWSKLSNEEILKIYEIIGEKIKDGF